MKIQELIKELHKFLNSDRFYNMFWAITSTLIFMVSYTIYFIFPAYNKWALKLPYGIANIIQIIIIYAVFFGVRLFVLTTSGKYDSKKYICTYSFVSGVSYFFMILEEVFSGSPYMNQIQLSSIAVLIFMLGTFFSPLFFLTPSTLINSQPYNEKNSKEDFNGNKKYNIFVDCITKANMILREAYEQFGNQFDVDMDTTPYSIIAAAIYAVFYLSR